MRRGLVYGATAYLIWGLFPLYWPLLEPAGAVEILAHRMVWSLVAMSIVVTVARQWRSLREASGRTWLLVVAASVFIAVNWGVYIFAVNNGAVLDAALGYFINPLVSVLLGVLVFHERLRGLQWASVALGGTAVVIIAVDGGKVPWIALILAASFGLYGLVKKVVVLPPQLSLTAEGLVLLLPATAYLVTAQVRGTGTLTGHGSGHVALLMLSGVITVIPLLAFAAAAQALPLSMLGLLQYLTPVIQFLLGVLWAHEHMPPARWVGFGLVWVALAALSFDGLRHARRSARLKASAAVESLPAPGFEATP